MYYLFACYYLSIIYICPMVWFAAWKAGATPSVKNAPFDGGEGDHDVCTSVCYAPVSRTLHSTGGEGVIMGVRV